MIYVIHWFVNILTLGLVSIATITTTTYHVDEPITELNNQSLNDVYYNSRTFLVDGYLNLNNGSYTSTPHLSAVLDYDNNIYTLTTSYAFAGVRSEFFLVNSNTQYAFLIDKISNTSATNPYISGGFCYYDSSYVFINCSLSNIYTSSNSGIILNTITTPSNASYVMFRVLNASSNQVVQFRDILLIEKDTFTDNVIFEYYDIYVQAKANNGVYIESTSHLNNNIHLVDVSVMVISFGFWTWLIKFLKGVII